MSFGNAGPQRPIAVSPVWRRQGLGKSFRCAVADRRDRTGQVRAGAIGMVAMPVQAIGARPFDRLLRQQSRIPMDCDKAPAAYPWPRR